MTTRRQIRQSPRFNARAFRPADDPTAFWAAVADMRLSAYRALAFVGVRPAEFLTVSELGAWVVQAAQRQVVVDTAPAKAVEAFARWAAGKGGGP